jgi:hypothetical protein
MTPEEMERELRGFKIGDRVRVVGFQEVATIVSTYRDIPGGVRLDRPFDGMFYSWNVDALEYAHRGEH